MNTTSTLATGKAPWHLWVVGIVALLWYASGAYTIFMAQAGKLPNLSEDEIAYYAAQPAWLVILTDIALLAGIAGAAALLLRRRAAVWLFAISFAATVIANAYDLASGAARALADAGALIVTCLILVIGLLLVLYSRAMARRGAIR